jgi:DNA-binding CsgD family transcriptional regulator/tetratricopeptide (TPR) repeat protein
MKLADITASPYPAEFVGREDALIEVGSLFAHVEAGRTSFAMLAGEPGIGKTSFAREIAGQAQQRSWRVFWGRSYENQPTAPFWPWQQIKRDYFALLREKSPQLLGRLAFAAVDSFLKTGTAKSEPGSDARHDDERIRFFDAYSTLLADASKSQPLLLILENLHCADEGTLQLLEFLSVELTRARVLILATYRNVDLGSEHPLLISLGELARAESFFHLTLEGLERSELAELARMTLGYCPPEKLIDALSRRTEGNPLYATELIKLHRENLSSPDSWSKHQKSDVPKTVALAIGSRLARHSRDCIELLRTASMLGREFELDALSRVTGEPLTRKITDDLQEAVRAGFIEEMPRHPATFRFTHALIKDVLMNDGSSSLTYVSREHIGTKLEEHYGDTADQHAATLAYHFMQTASLGSKKRLLHYGKLAAEEAFKAHDYPQTVMFYKQALDACDDATDKVITADMLFGIGRARVIDGDRKKGEKNLEYAFTLYTQMGHIDKAVEVATFPLVYLYGYEVSFTLVEQASDLVVPNTREWAWLETYRVLYEFRQQPDYERAADRFRKVRRLAGTLNDEILELHILLNWCFVGSASMRLDDVLPMLPGIDKLSQKVGSQRIRAIVELWQTATADREEARRRTENAMRISERVRDRALLCFMLSRLANQHLVDGKWDDARTVLDRAISVYPHGVFGSVLARRARVEYETGNIAAGDIFLNRYLDAYRSSDKDEIFDFIFLVELIGNRTRIIGRFKHIDVAKQIAVEAIDSPRASKRNKHHCLLWSGFLAATGKDTATAVSILAQLEELQRSLGRSDHSIIEGIVAVGAGDLDRGIAYIEEGIKDLQKRGNRPDLAWGYLERAEILAKQYKEVCSPQIHETLHMASAIARDVGMPALSDRIDSLYGSVTARDRLADGLSTREREVLSHVARGKTIQEIARDLVISEHTVAHHISAIFRKIGVTNRVDAALYTAKNGINAE